MNQKLIFRVVAFVLAGYFAFRTIVMGAYFLDEGRWGGSLMFLSNWNLLINFIIASCALYKEYDGKFNSHNLLLPASMGINIIVVILYWVLRAMGAFGDGTEDGWDVFDHLRNLYVHLGTTIILFIEAIFFNKIFGNLKQEYGYYMVIFISYIIWMEAFVAPNNGEPCGSVSCGTHMSKFMYSGSYTKKGVKGLLKEGGTARRDETVRIVESLGGKVEAYYWCYGSTDFLAIMDFPDHTTVTGMALNIAASGSFQGNITPLITVEEMDEMVKVSVGDWRAPGD